MCTVYSECVLICEMLTLMCIEHTSNISPVNIMIINIKLKVTIKFGASEMMCVELSSQKLQNIQFAVNVKYVKCSHLCVYNTPQSYRQLMKFKIMIINIKLKVRIKFGASEMMCVELRAQKLRNVWFAVNVKCSHSCSQHTSTLLPVNVTQDYDYK